jgi:hypothetical protein
MLPPDFMQRERLGTFSVQHLYNRAVGFLIRYIDLQYRDRYYLIPFPTLAGFIVAVVGLAVTWYVVRRLMSS